MPKLAGFDPEVLAPLRKRLDQHPVYGLRDLDALRHFMEHHVYSVWDFMSLIKYLQGHLAPARQPWTPSGDAAVRRFINELVLEEESDAVPGPDGVDRHMSHFELYCEAMQELGADPERPRRFVALASQHGIDAALDAGIAPEPAARFMRTTFDFIASGKPHVVAAALALGREHVIPGMFRSFLREMGIGSDAAPQFHFYLNRHVHLDEDFHGPMSLRMLDLLCAGDPVKLEEARVAASTALEARIAFWDGVHARLREAA
ncbi:DUF3050 domain-containing protein [Thioalkalivibrio paradoxus]|uniref:Hem oxygenase n=1 Tax=Thioalkalivibrio paradoxus ARh 1 TaxID=713585 RepID=W0DJQ7_9GAMM|nr:DUF3050 domain-containing protein [Thioalkalivibrio paradoxus]AHE98844.1 hem oxygenase [Thioalkalivibrio paradoxus ARh 1]